MPARLLVKKLRLIQEGNWSYFCHCLFNEVYRAVSVQSCWASLKTTKSACFTKMKTACWIVRQPDKTSNMGTYPRFRFEISFISASANLYPLAETANERTCHTKDTTSYDGGEAVAIWLLFWPRDAGLLMQKCGRDHTETSCRQPN